MQRIHETPHERENSSQRSPRGRHFERPKRRVIDFKIRSCLNYSKQGDNFLLDGPGELGLATGLHID
jgi:hypothetical protein